MSYIIQNNKNPKQSVLKIKLGADSQPHLLNGFKELVSYMQQGWTVGHIAQFGEGKGINRVYYLEISLFLL